MKRFSSIILGFIIGAFATYYLCPRQVDSAVDMDVDEHSIKSSMQEIAKTKVKKPKGVITPEEAKALSENWTKHREGAVNAAARKQGRDKDNRSTWWSLSDIEDYIAYSKHVTDSLGYNITGMRVYLGVYGNKAGKTKKDLTTMFVVPTIKEATAKASTSLINFQTNGGDCPTCPPLNHGGGGGQGYP